MFGLPDAQIRWAIARTPADDRRRRDGRDHERGRPAARAAPRGSRRDLLRRRRCAISTARSARLKALGAPVVSRSGGPVTIGAGTRIVIVEGSRRALRRALATGGAAEHGAPPSANVIGVRLRLAVADVEAAARLYRDELGLAAARAARRIRQQRGRAATRSVWRAASIASRSRTCRARGSCTTSSISKASNARTCRGEFKTSARRACNCAFATSTRRSPCSSASAAKWSRRAAQPLALPAGNSTLKVAIVRDPNNLFVVLIEAPPAA